MSTRAYCRTKPHHALAILLLNDIKSQSVTLYLDSNFEEKRKEKEGEGRERKGMEEKWKENNTCLFRREGKGREIKFSLQIFPSLKRLTLNKNPLSNPSISLPFNFVIQTRDPSFLQSLPFLSLCFLPSNTTFG